jgi:hypothetical protein
MSVLPLKYFYILVTKEIGVITLEEAYCKK